MTNESPGTSVNTRSAAFSGTAGPVPIVVQKHVAANAVHCMAILRSRSPSRRRMAWERTRAPARSHARTPKKATGPADSSTTADPVNPSGPRSPVQMILAGACCQRFSESGVPMAANIAGLGTTRARPGASSSPSPTARSSNSAASPRVMLPPVATGPTTRYPSPRSSSNRLRTPSGESARHSMATASSRTLLDPTRAGWPRVVRR